MSAEPDPEPKPQAETEGEAPAHKHRRRRPWFIISLVILVVSGLVAFKLKQRWDRANNTKILVESSKLFQSGEIDRAVQLLSKLLQKSPNNPTVLRELARKFDEYQRWNDSLALWQRLSKRPEATDDDRIELAGALIKSGDDTGARMLLASLNGPARQRFRYVELQAILLQQEGRNQEAEKMMFDAWKKTASEPSSSLKLAQMGFANLPDAARGEAGRILWEFARGRGPLSVEALTTLAASRPNSSDVDEILKILNNRDDISPANRYNILQKIIKQVPAMKDSIVDAESVRIDPVPLEKRGDFYEWMAGLGYALRILQDLSDPSAQGATPQRNETVPRIRPRRIVYMSGKLFLAYADALIMSRMWDELRAMLQNPNLPLNRVEVELMLAIAAQSRQQALPAIVTHLNNALNLAKYANGTDQLWRVAHVSERLNLLGTSLEALNLIAKDRRSRFKSLVRSYHLQQILHESESMLVTAEAILELRPGLQPYADEALYLGMLTGLRIDHASELAVEPPDATPLRRLVSAMAAYHCGDMERMHASLKGINPSDLQPGHRAVLAGLLDEAGKKSEGYQIAEKILTSALAPDEFWFYQLAVR